MEIKKGNNKLRIVSSWDDGSKLDIKLAGLLKKYNISGTFFIPNNTKLSEDEIRSLVEQGFKIGGHT